jgi:hypothetical protein
MKSPNKTRTNKTKSSSKSKAALLKVSMIHKKTSNLRHFRLVEHKHTGKLIHHSHTSHLSLVLILAIVGVLMFINNDIVKAESSSGSVTIGALVKGPAPSVGAVITSPLDGAKIVDVDTIDISGTCAPTTFVVVKNGTLAAGSTVCNDAGVFGVTIQVNLGENILSAMNYDNYNQPGPETLAITVNIESATEEPEIITPINPITPENPSIIPGVPEQLDSCNDYQVGALPTSSEPHVSVVCIPRIFGPGITQVMGVLAWGGTPPYAISVEWGDEKIDNTLLSIMSPGYKVVPFKYNIPGVYNIELKMTDHVGEESIVQTAVQVSGTVVTQPSNTVKDKTNKTWLLQPAPIYLLAVAITVGFWIGDIFDRRFGAGNARHHYKTTTKKFA